MSVRYIHDILKADVIVKKTLMRTLRAKSQTGEINADDFLTAKFNITGVLLNSQAKQGDKIRDLYAEATDINQPLQFWKEDKVVHTQRPVEAYVLDESGKRLDEAEVEFPIRTAQRWILSQTTPGEAEMSANLGDLLKAPEGEVVLDPSMTFQSDIIKDTRLQQNSYTSYYSSWYAPWQQGYENDYLLFGFYISSLPAGIIVNSAFLSFYHDTSTIASSSITAKAYKLLKSWDSNANWYNRTYDPIAWSSPGASSIGNDYSNPAFQSPTVTLHNSANQWDTFDVSMAFKSHISSSTADVYDKGFIVKMLDSSNGYMDVYMSNNSDTSHRPKLTVNYTETSFGVDVGNANDGQQGFTTNDRQNAAKTDNFSIIRYGCLRTEWGDDIDKSFMLHMVDTAYTNNMKVIFCYPAGRSIYPFTSSTQYANYIESHLHALSTGSINYINNGSVIAIEIGAEEDDTSYQWTKVLINPGPPPVYSPTEAGGGQFAVYYLAAWDKIKTNSSHPEWKNLEIISGGSVIDFKWISRTDTQRSKLFVKGFLDVIQNNLSKVPDVIAVHSYTGSFPPESNGGDWREFQNVQDELFNMCNSRGFIPNFAATEYGYSATHRGSYTDSQLINVFGPINRCDNYTQAIYYLRSRLIHACMIPYYSGNYKYGIGASRSCYFHHPREGTPGIVRYSNPGQIWEWGFQNFDAYPGSSRAIRLIARKLMDSTTGLMLGSADRYTWIPIQTIDDSVEPDPVRIAWCGFKSNIYSWLCVWKYDNTNNFYTNTGSSATIQIPGNYQNNSLYVYRFNITQDANPTYYTIDGFSLPSRQGTATFDDITNQVTITRSPSSGSTIFNISNVKENPMFIRITN